MRYMIMHKVNASTEAGVLPSPELMAGMGKLVQDAAKAGVFRNGEGLRPSSTRVRLNFSRGQRTLTKGPLVGSNELVAGFALMKVQSMDEAIEWATRFARIVGDVEIDVGPVTEPWDLGVMPKPTDAPLRVLAVHKADESSEAGAPPSPQMMADMAKLVEDMSKAGVLLATEGLMPSSTGWRLRYRGGKRTVIDGPFAESKELIAGFVILDVKTKDDVFYWAQRFADVVGDVEMDVRPLFDVEHSAPERGIA
ncbi:YciI family protein [Anaeromyxobacter terrae]|uniref:YciI family protein n=1 Tax=Anaeromyxobacter terrae TaxID=2925406 RepID=UPI001F5650CF|nr:YciI family protein [Anaeromyxobacter sp. SG22]